MTADPAPAAFVLVRIYEITREWSTHVWLCDPCAAERRKTRIVAGQDRAWRLSQPKLAAPILVRVENGACPVDFTARRPLGCIDCRANEGLL